jgi:hypothetical protein
MNKVEGQAKRPPYNLFINVSLRRGSHLAVAMTGEGIIVGQALRLLAMDEPMDGQG